MKGIVPQTFCLKSLFLVFCDFLGLCLQNEIISFLPHQNMAVDLSWISEEKSHFPDDCMPLLLLPMHLSGALCL